MKIVKFFILLVLLAVSCRKDNVRVDHSQERDLPEIERSGRLVVLTMYGSTSYFQYRDQDMGFQYELSRMLADDLGLKLELKTASTLTDLGEMLRKGEGDLIAYRFPVSNSAKEGFLFMDEDYVTSQILVQPVTDSVLTEVEQLYGKTVHVPRNSKYALRLENLNQEMGGGINVILEDSLTTDDLIEKVASLEIPFTVADKEVAMLNKTYFRNIDHNLAVGVPQRSTWAVRKTSPLLFKRVNEWLKNIKSSKQYQVLYKKYFINKHYLLTHNVHPYFNERGISPYDDLFRKYSKRINWDWRLLMAVAFQESKFDPTAESWSGAKGLMQLTVPTAKRMGLDERNIFNPEKNLKAGVKNIAEMQRIFKTIKDKDEQTKFVLAAYNSGVAHVFDARAMAQKFGKNRDVWAEVAPYMIMKSDSTVFSDTTLCKYGYSRGAETVEFVNNVLNHFEEYKKRVK